MGLLTTIVAYLVTGLFIALFALLAIAPYLLGMMDGSRGRYENFREEDEE